MSAWDDAMTKLVTDRGAALLAFGRVLTGSTAEAEDLVHDALVKVFSQRGGPVGRAVRGTGARAVEAATDGEVDVIGVGASTDLGGLEGYVRRAMSTIYVDHWRRRQRFRRVSRLASRPEAVPSVADEHAQSDELLRALGGLTPRERLCVVLRHYEQLSTRQTADALGVAEGTVKRALHDAMGKLRLALDDTTDHELPEGSRR